MLYVETDSGLMERPDEKAEASGRWGLLERWTELDWTGGEGSVSWSGSGRAVNQVRGGRKRVERGTSVCGASASWS